jgi:hypothetical protein
MKMPHWMKLIVAGLGVAGAVAATLASGGTLAVAIAAGASAATGALATLYHPTPGSDAEKK